LNMNRLEETVRSAIHFLDNVIDVNKYPLSHIEKISKKTRKVGLGVMGFADMLLKMGIPYDSDEAVSQAEMIMSFISEESRKASAALAQKRGNFPCYKGSVFDDPSSPYMRNATTTTIAPTGTISIIASASSGIEPIFAVAYSRHVLDGQSLPEIHPLFIKIAKKEKFYSKKLVKEIVKTGSVQSLMLFLITLKNFSEHLMIFQQNGMLKSRLHSRNLRIMLFQRR